MFDLESAQEASINLLGVRAVYPTDGSLTPTQQAGSANDVEANYIDMTAGFDQVGAGGVGPSAVTGPTDGGGGGGGGGGGAGSPPKGWTARPVTWIVVLAVFVTIIMFTAHKTGNEDEFGSIRASGYNVLLIGTVAMLFFLVTKAVVGATAVGKTGLGTAVLAA
ncbi:MAG TPA: hypothetical protein VK807_23305 [Gemmatimonadaceae bacterium]|jgi:hypothetical protein|nr:hypothetical protein [Gemmatimonadaceae bacterium]